MNYECTICGQPITSDEYDAWNYCECCGTAVNEHTTRWAYADDDLYDTLTSCLGHALALRVREHYLSYLYN